MLVETWGDIEPGGILTVEMRERQTEFRVRSHKDRRRRVNRYVFSVRYLGVEFRKTKEVPASIFLTPESITGRTSSYGIVVISKCDFDNFLAGEPTTGAQQ